MPNENAPTPFDHVVSFPHTGVLYALCQDGASGRLYVAGSDATVHVLNPDAEKPKLEPTWILHANYISGLVMAGGRLVSGGYDRRLLWSDPESGRVLHDVPAHEGWVRDLAAFPDGQRVASVGDDMLVKIWDQDGKLVRTLEGHAQRTPQGFHSALYAVAVSPDGRLVASGDRTGQVRLWETETGRLVHELNAPAFYTYDPSKRDRSIGGIRAVRFSDDGSRLAASGIGQVTNVDGFVGPCRVEVWEPGTGQHVFTGRHDHKAILNDMRFHDNWILAAGGGDSGGVLIAWKLDQPDVARVAKPKGHVHRLSLDAVGHRLYAAGFESLQVWTLQLDKT